MEKVVSLRINLVMYVLNQEKKSAFVEHGTIRCV